MATADISPYTVVDVNIENTCISDYVVFQDEFIVYLKGGNGFFLDLQTQTVAYLENLEEMTMVFKMGTLEEEVSQEYARLLSSWKNSSTRLTLLGSPLDPFLLAANDDEWIAAPRTSAPRTA